MQYTAEDIKQIEDFQKYARFLCEHFDISVELDSTQARTDGKVINLPNVVGLNEEELDMMYAILLHEVGHIKYSCFDESYFSQLKTEGHAYLANAIEDARIENLLMKEFGGGKDIFTKLYTEHVVNKDRMRKLFKLEDSKNPDLFSSMAIYIHNNLVNCETAPLSTYTTKQNIKKIENFMVQHDVDDLLSQAKLKDHNDVLALTNKIYDLFVNFHKDNSEKLTFSNDLKEKEKLEQSLESIQKEVERKEAFLKQIEQHLQEKVSEKKDWHELHDEVFNKLIGERSSLVAQNNMTSDLVHKKEKLAKLEKQLSNKLQSLNKSSIKSEELKKSIYENQKQFDSKVNEKGKALTEEKLAKLEEKIKSQIEQLKKLSNKNPVDEAKTKELQKEMGNLSYQLTDEEKRLDVSSLKNSIDSNKEKIDEINDKLNPLEQMISQLNREINELDAQKQSIVQNAKNELVAKLYELESLGEALGMPLSLLPEFEETIGWPEADDVQKQMDEKFGKERKEPVRNGMRVAGMFGSNLRDISIYIDNKKEQVKEISLLDIFKEKTDFSLLPELNETVQVTKYTTDKSVFSDWSSLSKHTVLTTEFDMVKQETVSKDMKEYANLLKENAGLIQQMKKVFVNKFKFTKKPRFRGGKEDGELDSRSLWKLATRYSEDYFEVNNPKFVNKMAASILVDISGSQNKEESEYGKKLKALTLALSEALKAVHVNHEILGYHAPVNDLMRSSQAAYTYNRRSNALETIIYKNFKQKENAGITNMNIETSDNSDGESLRIAIKRLKRESAKSRVLFVITDGKPFLSDGDINILDADLKAALREAVRDKVEVFAFGFAPNGVDFYGDRFCYIQKWEDASKFVEKWV